MEAIVLAGNLAPAPLPNLGGTRLPAHYGRETAYRIAAACWRAAAAGVWVLAP
jgi:hypothetical protein